MKNEYEIVIVEDNPNDAELMVRALKKKNLLNNLIVLKDGVQALDFMFSTGEYSNKKLKTLPKVIFLDLKLPKMDGLKVLEKLKSSKRTKNIPVVILTSSNQDPDIKTAYSLGANSYVVKPVDFNNFSEVVSKLGLYWLLVNVNAK